MTGMRMQATTPTDATPAVRGRALRKHRRGYRRRQRRIERGRPRLPLWLALLLAVAAVPLMHWAYPPISVWPLAFPAAALVLLSCIGRSAWDGVLVGFVHSIAFTLWHLIWLTRYLGAVPWLALSALESCIFAVGTVPIVLAYRWIPKVRGGAWARVALLPAIVAGLWTARELVQGNWPYTGFPWLRLGMTQTDGPIARVASWIGVSGITFLMVFIVASVIEIVRVGRVLAQTPTRRHALRAVPAAAVAAVLLALPQFPTVQAGSMRVAAVQGNGPTGYFDDRARDAVLQAQLAATDAVLAGADDEPIDVLLWPEGGIDSDPLRNAVTAERLTLLSEALQAPLIVNAATQRGELTYNTSLLWQGAEGAVALHDKTHPVPLGEYVPDRWFYEAIVPDLIGLIGREYTPGTNPPIFEVNGVGVGLAICFDVIYDSVIWDGGRDGAEVYMFQTNNADFRGTVENLQQLAFARMRAIETNRSVVNISTVGTSQVIAPDGTTTHSIGTDQAGAIVADVELRTGLTPVMVIGAALQWTLFAGSLAATALAGVLADRQRRRHSKSAAPDGAAL